MKKEVLKNNIKKTMSKLWHDTDALVFTIASISIANIHEVLSLCGLCLSIGYTLIKIKNDFIDKK